MSLSFFCPICFGYYGKPHRLGAQTRVCDRCHSPGEVGESRTLRKRQKSGSEYTANSELEILRRRAREEIRA